MNLLRMFWPMLLLLPLASSNAVAQDTLPDSVARMVSAFKMSPDTLSVFVQDVEKNTPLLEINSDVPRNPASTIKLLTTYLALEDLGPTYQFLTEAYLSGVLAEGRLDGDLIVKGYGDPYMLIERYWLFLRKLRQHGLKRIDGDLVIDNSFFEKDMSDISAFDGQPERIYNVVPDAFLVNFQAVDFTFRPDAKLDRVTIVADPQPSNLLISNKMRLGSGYCGGYQNGIKMEIADSGPDTGERDQVTFSGRFRGQCREYHLSRAVMRAPAYAYGLFKSLWTEMGGELQGGWRLGVVPAEAEPFVSFESPPLQEIIRGVNKWSNNVMARHILLTMGVERYGAPGTVEKGRKAAAEVLAEKGLDFPELQIDNGAGLSRETRISARNLGRVLLAAHDSLYGAEYISSLPMSGLDGTLRKRFADEELTGRMHLKTGRLKGVFAMAGYVKSRAGREYVVVAIQNQANAHRGPGEEIQSELMRWVYSQ
jgi:D-alanyl-D-alanine carboxypeptidase/D-alanyl-D-alanine-endopeptidase (penicillin-binding protein 4)